MFSSYILLYCIVLYCTVLYCILYGIYVLSCTTIVLHYLAFAETSRVGCDEGWYVLEDHQGQIPDVLVPMRGDRDQRTGEPDVLRDEKRRGYKRREEDIRQENRL